MNIIIGAFYPNIFTRTTPDSYKYERESFQCIGGHDPKNTVYFTGFQRDLIRDLYVKPIKNLFVVNNVIRNDNASNVIVSFEEGANKAYVTFKTRTENDDRMTGKIQTEVYKAIKMRLLRIPMKIRVIK